MFTWVSGWDKCEDESIGREELQDLEPGCWKGHLWKLWRVMPGVVLVTGTVSEEPKPRNEQQRQSVLDDIGSIWQQQQGIEDSVNRWHWFIRGVFGEVGGRMSCGWWWGARRHVHHLHTPLVNGVWEKSSRHLRELPRKQGRVSRGHQVSVVAAVRCVVGWSAATLASAF